MTIALAGAAAVLLVLSAVTARRPTVPVPALDGYLRLWQLQHNASDVDPATTPFVAQTLRLAYALSRPLARAGVRPDVLTMWGLWLAAGVPVAANLGGRWLIAGAAIAGLSAFTDALDGCVAALTDRSTRYGFVLDSVVDRVADVLLLVALHEVSGATEAAVAAGVGLGLLEYTRARAGNAGLGEVAVITVGERPTRVVIAALSLLGGGVTTDWAVGIATFGLWSTVAVTTIGLLQLAVAVRRRLA